MPAARQSLPSTFPVGSMARATVSVSAEESRAWVGGAVEGGVVAAAVVGERVLFAGGGGAGLGASRSGGAVVEVAREGGRAVGLGEAQLRGQVQRWTRANT